MTTNTPDTVDPANLDGPTDALTRAYSLMAHAHGLAQAARAARGADDHQTAGVLREQERSAISHAKVLTSIVQAEEIRRIRIAVQDIGLGQ